MEMERKVVRLRPSPNEEAQMIREEHERRRKLRIQQVREQQRYISLHIRQEVEKRRQLELEKLGKELKADWERQQREKLDLLQRLYQESLQLVGQGHRSAKENEPDLAAIAQREEENQAKAAQRHREALKELKSQKLKELERQSRGINARKKALQTERERAAKVASLPPPPPNPIQNIDSKKPHVVKKSDVGAFAASHYHMPESAVDREEDTGQPDAREGAELEVRRLQYLQEEEQRRREEQLERARLRGRQALRREHLVQDRERLLVELEHLQQTDLLRRRQQVAQMPPQIFQPLYKRQEMREDFQREMEFAFEDMYTGERRVKGDLVVQLVPEPLPALSIGSRDQELDVTQDEICTPGAENTQEEAERSEQGASPTDVPSKPEPRRALKKLLDRIRSQRTHWADQNGSVAATDSPPANTHHVPERDTTIDTGSLTSEEKGIPAPEPGGSASALETTESAAEPLQSDGLQNRIQEFEEERKKREEELEREKQQQLLLLQELEEQKAKLEQMLLEAQQEREQLKAAVNQQAALIPPEVPAEEQRSASVSSGGAAALIPASGEDGHSSRIREYQQRLLEQNRTHQRTVEVARQRLEEYQRALRIRHSMTAVSSFPPDVPPRLTPPPPQSAPSLRPPAPIVSAQTHSKAPTPVEVPTRDSDSRSSRSRHTGSSLSVGSRLLSNEEQSELFCKQRADVTAWVTDSIMERVTRHLTERETPPSVAPEPPSYKTATTRQPTTTQQPTTTGQPTMTRQPTTTYQLTTTGQITTTQLPTMTRQPTMTWQPTSTYHPPTVPLQPSPDSTHTSRQSVPVDAARLQPLSPPQTGPLGPSADDLERQRRELLEVQRRFLEQKELLAQQQRRQEEDRGRQEAEREAMRQQKEKLQALMLTEEEPTSEASSEVLVSDVSETRRKILASLLKVIEENSGGSLSHLEDPGEEDGSAHDQPSNNGEIELVSLSDLPAGPPPALLLHPPRAAKPPVTRVRLGVLEMTEQHELSVIPEVETPINTSLVTGPEESVTLPSATPHQDPHEETDSSAASDTSLHDPSVSVREQQTTERPDGSGTSRRSSYQAWREKLLEAAASPLSSESDSVLRIISPVSSDSGRGADYSGAAMTSLRSPSESALKPPDSDCLSSTTISTGSYITSDPELNLNSGKSPPCKYFAERRRADFLDISSPSVQSVCEKESSAAPAPDVDSLFSDVRIQSIIDRYTRELDLSLNIPGRSAERELSFSEEPGPSVSQQSLLCVSVRSEEDEGAAAPHAPAAEQRRGLEPNRTVLDQSPRADPSLSEDSFRPLIGHLADQSSCLTADLQDSSMEQLVGQPSAHSSMIGQQPGPSVSVSLDQGGWDSTLTRMIGRLSHQSSSHWLSSGQDLYAGQLVGEMPSERSTTWLDGGREETLMRPLVGELDESAGLHSGSSGEITRVDLGVSTEASVPSYPTLPPEASSHIGPVQDLVLSPQEESLQDHERTEAPSVFPDSDSFHPLLAEVTHNETADPSLIFIQPEPEGPNSPEGQPDSSGQSVSLPSLESDTHEGPSVELEASPERLRGEDPSSRPRASASSQESASLLWTSQLQPNQSVLTVSPQRTDVELTALDWSGLSVSDRLGSVDMPQPEEAETNSISEQNRDTRQSSDQRSGEQESGMKDETPASLIIKEAACEKGILEQSEITLVSLTDTTLQDQETTVAEEEEDANVEGVEVEGARGQGTETAEPVQLTETTEDERQKHPGLLLEFQWGPGENLQEVCQQKRRALLQRSSQRVEEIKTRAALAKTQPKTQEPSQVRAKPAAKESRPARCKATKKSETRHKSQINPQGGPSEGPRPPETSGPSSQRKPVQPVPVSDSRLKGVEVKVCTTEQRKRDVAEMHQRTQRLYEQLEEVKHQRAVRSRQQDYAKNRLKAKEFHKKTLQKLRAKQA